jgi:hypothetical protein
MGWFERRRAPRAPDLDEVRAAIADREPTSVYAGVAYVDAEVGRTLSATGQTGDLEAGRRVQDRMTSLLCIDPVAWLRHVEPELVPEYQTIAASPAPDAAGHAVCWLWSLHPDVFRPLVDDLFLRARPMLEDVARSDADQPDPTDQPGRAADQTADGRVR